MWDKIDRALAVLLLLTAGMVIGLGAGCIGMYRQWQDFEVFRERHGFGPVPPPNNPLRP